MELPDGLTSRPLTDDDARAVFEVMAAEEEHDLGKAEIEEADIVGDWQRPSFDVGSRTVARVGAGCPACRCSAASPSSPCPPVAPSPGIAINSRAISPRPATRCTSSGTSRNWMRTGTRCAKRTHVKIGFTVARPWPLGLAFVTSMPRATLRTRP